MPGPSFDSVEFDATVGWCAVPALLSADEVSETLAVCDQLLGLAANERYPGDKPVAGTRHLVALDERSDVIERIVGGTRLTDVVGQILGSSFHRIQVSYRSPQPSFGAQKLHADDVPRLSPAPDSMATAIIALTEFTTTNGSTRLVPGSHHRPDLQRHAGSLESHPDEVQLTGVAGTAFVFSGHVLHSGTVNNSQVERPALQLLWQKSVEPEES